MGMCIISCHSFTLFTYNSVASSNFIAEQCSVVAMCIDTIHCLFLMERRTACSQYFVRVLFCSFLVMRSVLTRTCHPHDRLLCPTRSATTLVHRPKAAVVDCHFVMRCVSLSVVMLKFTCTSNVRLVSLPVAYSYCFHLC